MQPTILSSKLAATTLLLTTVAALVVPPASATTIHVPADQTTIAAGIAAASPGDTVEIACDTYYEHGLVISSAITLRSTEGDFTCVTIDGDATDTILYLTDASGAVVSGITFRNGAALFGAGVHVDSCDVAFRNRQFYNNSAEVDPLFCGLGGAWFALCENSYCAYGNNPSGMQIGAHGPNCNACDSPAEMQSWGCIKAMFR